MHGVAIALVLLSAIFHATWNAQLKGVDDRSRFMVSMCLAVGLLSLLCVPFVPWPSMSSWRCIAASAFLHIIYNLVTQRPGGRLTMESVPGRGTTFRITILRHARPATVDLQNTFPPAGTE